MSFRTTIILGLEADDAESVLNARYKVEKAVVKLMNEFSKFKPRVVIHTNISDKIREVGAAKPSG